MTTNADQPPLDGLELDALIANRGSLRKAVTLTLEALKSEGLLSPIYTAQAQLALVLADVVEDASARGKAAAAGLASRQMLDALDALPKPVDADTADRFAALVAALEAEVNKP